MGHLFEELNDAYDVREPIEVRVKKEMIEIVSFPSPDRFVTQEGLRRY